MKKILIGSLVLVLGVSSIVGGIVFNRYNDVKYSLNNDKNVSYIKDYKDSEVKYNVIDNKVTITVPNSSLDSRASEDVLKLEEELLNSEFSCSLSSSEKEQYKNEFRNAMREGLEKAKEDIKDNVKKETGVDVEVKVNLK